MDNTTDDLRALPASDLFGLGGNGVLPSFIRVMFGVPLLWLASGATKGLHCKSAQWATKLLIRLPGLTDECKNPLLSLCMAACAKPMRRLGSFVFWAERVNRETRSHFLQLVTAGLLIPLVACYYLSVQLTNNAASLLMLRMYLKRSHLDGKKFRYESTNLLISCALREELLYAINYTLSDSQACHHIVSGNIREHGGDVSSCPNDKDQATDGARDEKKQSTTN